MGERAGDRERGPRASGRARPSRPRRRAADRGRDGRGDPPRAGRGGGRPARLPARASPRSSAPPSGSSGLPADVDLHRLHGSLDPAAQRAAIAPSPPGRRKLVLATSIAETSLTLDGVRIVVDSGLARRPRYDRAAGLTRLVTERASQAAVAQRAGRAGRQGPGRVYRLWEEAATQSLPRFDPPEILEADLSALLLDCAIWGVADPRDAQLARSAAGRRGRRGAEAPAPASARSARTAARPRTAAPSPRCRCRRASPTC